VGVKIAYVYSSNVNLVLLNQPTGFGLIEIDYITLQGHTITTIFTAYTPLTLTSALFIQNWDYTPTGFSTYFGNTQVVSVNEKATYANTDDQANYIWNQIGIQKSYSVINTGQKMALMFLL
jgi:hypothetical protein